MREWLDDPVGDGSRNMREGHGVGLYDAISVNVVANPRSSLTQRRCRGRKSVRGVRNASSSPTSHKDSMEMLGCRLTPLGSRAGLSCRMLVDSVSSEEGYD